MRNRIKQGFWGTLIVVGVVFATIQVWLQLTPAPHRGFDFLRFALVFWSILVSVAVLLALTKDWLE